MSTNAGYQPAIETEKTKTKKRISYVRALIALLASVFIAIYNLLEANTILAVANIATGIAGLLILSPNLTNFLIIIQSPTNLITKLTMAVMTYAQDVLIDPYYDITSEVYCIALIFKYLVLAATMAI